MQCFADNSPIRSGPLTGCLFQQLNPCIPETALSEVLSVVRVMGLRAPPPTASQPETSGFHRGRDALRHGRARGTGFTC
ncbi:hypothetical protein SCOCK_810016 [Actinacidiphila cocklensis]|uniref:Uncharacterized protein n=1 Tax=Actinacidiphila cocklensis TaxID=887465 RepID=A0A9W4GWN3_9ACTN|nr:hypothetical protein SCOCK_810016 [Actinacidiphila cocklensis]